MNLKAIVPLGLAAVLGLVAIFLVRNAIAHKNGVTVATGNTVAVVVAKRDANPGTALTRDDLIVAHLPADAAPGQVFSNPDQVVGRVVQTPVVRGEAILESLLAPAGSGRGLPALIPPGMRAVTIEVNEYTGVGGMLEPGCRVDLVSVIRDDKTKESVARTVLQNIKVSAIGRSTAPAEAPSAGQPLPPPPNSVTILVTPQQVQTLQLASMSGRPWLVLRSTRDGAEVPLEGTTLSEVLGHTGDDVKDPNDPGTGEVANGTSGGTAGAGTATTSVNTAPTLPATPVSTSTDNAQPQPAQPTYIKRTVSIIREGVESTYIFKIPVPPPAQKPMDVETDQSAVIPNSK